MKDLLEKTLLNINCAGEVIGKSTSPQVITYKVRPGKGVTVAKIRRRAEDLVVGLGKEPIRVVALPGAIGIEVPAEKRQFFTLRRAMVTQNFALAERAMSLPLILGIDKHRLPVVRDLATFPHLLVAGATGSGKSVCVNAAIQCLLLTRGYSDAQFVMIDPKRVELSRYKDKGQVIAFVDDMLDAGRVLARLCDMMESRYEDMERLGATDISQTDTPRIVVVIDEMADLILQSYSAEYHLVRLAQKGRAAGIHIIAATQRPTVDVVTGTIKANFPVRMAFKTVTRVDSRVILDQNGAEGLLGKGDGLLMMDGELTRVQGCMAEEA